MNLAISHHVNPRRLQEECDFLCRLFRVFDYSVVIFNLQNRQVVFEIIQEVSTSVDILPGMLGSDEVFFGLFVDRT